MKNVILVGVIVVCLAVAGLVVFRGDSDTGINSIPEDEQVWTLCMACQNAQQMGKRAFLEARNEKSAEMIKAGASPTAAVYLTCEKCGKDAVTEARKCEKCGEVFRKGAIPGDYSDKCPKCKYSPTEAKFKERTGQ